MFLILYIVAYFVKHRLVWKEIRRCNSFSSKTFAFPSFRNKVVCRSTQKNQIYAFVQERNITSPSQKQLLFYCFVSCKLIRNCYKICAFTLTVRAPTGGGQCPGAALFGGGALLVKRRNSKWSFTNEPEVRFRFYILVKVGPTIRLAGTVPV